MRLGEPVQRLVARFVNDLLVLLIPNNADAIEEQQREDVSLEIGRIHRTAQNVGGFPKMAFKLTKCYLMGAQVFNLFVVTSPKQLLGMSYFQVELYPF